MAENGTISLEKFDLECERYSWGEDDEVVDGLWHLVWHYLTDFDRLADSEYESDAGVNLRHEISLVEKTLLDAQSKP